MLVTYAAHRNPQGVEGAGHKLQITHQTVRKILWELLRMIPYKLQLLQSANWLGWNHTL